MGEARGPGDVMSTEYDPRADLAVHVVEHNGYWLVCVNGGELLNWGGDPGFARECARLHDAEGAREFARAHGWEVADYVGEKGPPIPSALERVVGEEWVVE